MNALNMKGHQISFAYIIKRMQTERFFTEEQVIKFCIT